MTRRERLEAVIAQNITDELIEECKEELKKLDARNAKRAEQVTPHQKENMVIADAIISILSEREPQQIDPLTDAVMSETGFTELQRQRVQGVCINLIKEGRLRSEDVKVKGKGKRKVYTIV